MEDVKQIFKITFILRNIALLLFTFTTAVFIYLGSARLLKNNRLSVTGDRSLGYLFKNWLFIAAFIFIWLVLAIIIVAINWYHYFYVFHDIFFNNDYWMLDPNVDLLINIVPYPFFIAASIFIGVFFVVSLVLVFIISLLMLRLHKRTKKAALQPPLSSAFMHLV